MSNRKLRLWLIAMERFEINLRVAQARNRNAFIKAAAKDYENSGHVATHLLTSHRKRITDTLDAHYRVVIPHFGQMALKQIKSRRFERKQTLFESLIAEWIARESLRKAGLIADTDRDDILGAIEQGLAEGLGTAEIANNIRQVSQLTPFRAAVIARTETHAAATYGSIQSVRAAEEELGVKMLKEWLPTLDDRTRADHLAMAGQPPIPMDEKFIVGGVMMDRPGDTSAPPEQLINCRCALAYTEATN